MVKGAYRKSCEHLGLFVLEKETIVTSRPEDRVFTVQRTGITRLPITKATVVQYKEYWIKKSEVLDSHSGSVAYRANHSPSLSLCFITVK